MRARRESKDIIQLLERPLLRLGHEAENEKEGDEVHGGVEAESARCAEGAQLAGERQRDHGSPKIIGRHRP